jgi:DnaJ-class molecular chaperone
MKSTICPNCNGDGMFLKQICCGNYREFGCCGNATIGSDQCETCQGTGYIEEHLTPNQKEDEK